MRLRQLRLENLRAFQSLDLDLDPGWNVFVGANGAGKTTLLEAAYLLSHARSFRGGPKDVLIRRGSDGYSVYGRVERAGASDALGLARSAGVLEARINGTPVAVADLLRHVAVACFEPGSHELISGAAEIRRRFLDWGVFHVEPDFLRVWRAFQRSLRQRNALLRAGGAASELDPGTSSSRGAARELVSDAQAICRAFRARSHRGFAGLCSASSATPRITMESGWRGEGDALPSCPPRAMRTSAAATRRAARIAPTGPLRSSTRRAVNTCRAARKSSARSRASSRRRGSLRPSGANGRSSASTTLRRSSMHPIKNNSCSRLRLVDAQMLITGTHTPEALEEAHVEAARFHVEPGQVRRLL